MKKTVLTCTNDVKLTSLISSVCKSCALEISFIKNGRELPALIESAQVNLLMLDSNLQEPCIIDLLYLLFNLKCELPIIVVGDCEEKVLLSIKRIGILKGLTVYSMHLKSFGNKTLTKILELIDKKNQLINDEAITIALEKNQFVMYYQPKISIADNKLVGVEALIRWNRPNHGLVPPDLFIPIAEKTGLIIPMTYWIIREVFSQYAAWKKEKIEISIAINLTAKILTDVILPDELIKMAKKYKVKPQHICFEITEAAAMHWPDIVLEVLTRIRLKGFSLSIDDFGTGYSSLVELQRLPFTELKIDRSFVNEIEYNKDNMHIVRSIIGLGKNMGLSLIAEGVETREALDHLKELGCDNMQGYLISKPLSASDFMIWYTKHIDEHGIYNH